MKREKKQIVGFDFQIIPLSEAKAMALAGDGNYSDLKAKLLDVLPTLEADQSFAFGLSKGEVPEDQRRGICQALSLTLKRAGHNWRVSYNSGKRLFILIPFESKTYVKQKHSSKLPNAHTNGKFEQLIEHALKLWKIQPVQLTGRYLPYPIRSMRKAIQYLAVRKMHLNAKNVSKFFGTTKDAVYFNVNRMNDQDKVHLGQLKKSFWGN